MKKSKKAQRKKINKIMSILLCVVSLITLILFKIINVIPNKFYILIIIIILIIDFIICKNIYQKGNKRNISLILSGFFTILMVIVMVYEIMTIFFLNSMGKNNFKIITYELIVLNESSYNNLNDLEKKEIGFFNENNSDYRQAIEKLNSELNFDNKYYENDKLVAALLNEKVDAIMLEQSTNKILKEEDNNYAKKIKVIYTFEIKIETSDIVKKVDVTKDSFNIYISGIDTYGSITSVSRSDVNIILSVNPKTRKIMITSIPRDYYVELKNGYKDKLTHAGIYGVEESVAAIENLLDIDINYFVKVNFTSLIDIVDALDGITVNSDYEFSTKAYDEYTKPYTFNKGKNDLNGEEALAFSRERKAFIDGDRTRNSNQQIIIKAIINKVLSPTILSNYNSLLNSLSKAFITNMTDDEITSFIKQELDLQKDWDISNYVLEGTDSYDYTYSYKNAKTYVMVPENESISYAKEKINNVLNN